LWYQARVDDYWLMRIFTVSIGIGFKRILSQLRKLALSLILVAISSLVHSVNFRDGSLSYLHGNNYKVEPDQQKTVTLEYVAAWDNWDMFMFVEEKQFSSSGSSVYGEFSPRLKLLTMNDSSWLKKISLATTFERGQNNLKTDLYGLGFDFKVEGFNFLNTNIYLRDDRNKSGKAYQVTTVWAYPFSIVEVPIVFDGFIDWIISSTETHESFHFGPQIKIDMKKWLNTSHQWYLGIEYDYWADKFGIENSDLRDSQQNTFSLLAKWHF
jgi:nucleoside-specific outer membrane channel protein Tsx